jgi:4-carboxymuconolactone decarboxylase
MADRDEILRRLTLGDEAFLERLIADRRSHLGPHQLDARHAALLRFGSLAAIDGPSLAFQHVVASALDAGLTSDQLLDALVVLGPVIGSTRVLAVAPKVALAVGYDVDAALEMH